MSSAPPNVTQMLIDWSHGDEAAFARLLPLIYGELRRMARRQMTGQQPGHTLQATALIHEAYLRMVDGTVTDWQSRAHFLGVAATAMRHVLVDAARARATAKRGGGKGAITLDESTIPSGRPAELLALDDALEALKKIHPRQAKVVELRYFAGFGVEEAAQVLGISEETVTRDWRAAKAWLFREMQAK